MLDIELYRVTGAPTSGSGGSTATPVSKVPGITYSGSAIEVFNTTVLSGGTSTLLEEHGEHVANGWHHVAPEGDEYEFAGQTRLLIKLATAPADAIDLYIVLIFEVVGGI